MPEKMLTMPPSGAPKKTQDDEATSVFPMEQIAAAESPAKQSGEVQKQSGEVRKQSGEVAKVVPEAGEEWNLDKLAEALSSSAPEWFRKRAKDGILGVGIENIVHGLGERLVNKTDVLYTVNAAKIIADRAIERVKAGETVSPEDERKDLVDAVERHAEEQQKKLDELRGFFKGVAYVPRTHFAAVTLHVTGEAVDAVKRSMKEVARLIPSDAVPEQGQAMDVPVVACVQARVDMQGATHILGSCPEARKSFTERLNGKDREFVVAYQTADTALRKGSNPDPTMFPLRDRYGKTVDAIATLYPNLVSLRDAVNAKTEDGQPTEESVEMKKALKAFTERLIEYFREKKNTFDFGGLNNVNLQKRHGKWTVGLYDAFSPPIPGKLEGPSLENYDRLVAGDSGANPSDVSINDVNSVRVANVLAEIAGITDRYRPGEDILRKKNPFGSKERM